MIKIGVNAQVNTTFIDFTPAGNPDKLPQWEKCENYYETSILWLHYYNKLYDYIINLELQHFNSSC